MTTPDPQSSPSQPAHQDRVFRSTAGIAGGVLLLGLGVWFGVDALIRGEGRTPWLVLASLILLVPLVIAYTVRPAVFTSEDTLRVRNPFRTITLPWGAVGALRAGYTNEVLVGDHKYQLWAIPVSLRARKKAARQQMRAATDDPHGRTASVVAQPARAAADQAVDDLREIAERRASAPEAQGEPAVRWAYEILVPTLVGAVLLVALVATG